jgi:hypothetical protein
LAAAEKARIPETDDYLKRIISTVGSRIHLPILILGNTLNDDSKISYPISKVSITKDLKSESGLKFSFLDIATSTFKNEIIIGLGHKLKEEGSIPYDMNEESQEFFEMILEKLQNTVIKIRGVSKEGFTAPMKEYSFFPFDNKNIAAESGAGEREAIINYKSNDEIMRQVGEYLDLFEQEVDGLISDWDEKYLQEYYNSALGAPLKANVAESAPAPKIELKEEVAQPVAQPVTQVAIKPAEPEKTVAYTEDGQAKETLSDEAFNQVLNNPSGLSVEPSMDEINALEFDADEDGDFFGEE